VGGPSPDGAASEASFGYHRRLAFGDRVWHLQFVSASDQDADGGWVGQPSFMVLVVGVGLGLALWMVAFEFQVSRVRLRNLTEIASDWFWEVDTEIRFTFLSRKFFELTGLERGAVIGREAGEVLISTDAATALIRDCLRGDAGEAGREALRRGIEVTVTTQAGAVRYFRISGQPAFYDNGVFRGFQGTGTEITERKRAELEAAKQAERLHAAIEAMPNGIIMFDESLVLRVYNRKFLDLWDLSDDLLVLHPDMPALVRFLAERGDYGPGLPEELARVRMVRILNPEHESYELRHCSGRILEVRTFGKTTSGYLLTYNDVTERRLAEQQVRESERRLSEILELSPVGVSILHRETRQRLFWNRCLAGLLGTDAERPLAETFVDPKDYYRMAAAMACGDSLSGVEVLRRRGDGSTWWCLMHTLPMLHWGEPACIAWHYDISERKRAELALAESEERLNLALEVTRALAWEVDFTTGRRWWSRNLPEITGYRLEEIEGRAGLFEHFIHPGDQERVRAAVRRHFAGETPGFRAEYRLHHRDGDWRWFEDTGRVIRDRNGKPLRFVGTLVDVTVPRATQAELIRVERMAALGRLVAGIAHEINTPIGLGVGVASHLEERTRTLRKLYEVGDMSQEDFEEYMSGADEAARSLLSNLRRAADLVRSFKQVAVDQSSGQRRRFGLRAYVDEVLLSLRPKLRRTSHRVSVSCPDDLVLQSHPGALSQILTNLIDNSLIHGFDQREDGVIEIEAHREGATLVLTYRDDGWGMSAEQSERVFEPFYTTRRGAGGSGLGMHVVFNLVTQTLGGQIELRSVPGAGVSFVIRFPVEMASHEPTV